MTVRCGICGTRRATFESLQKHRTDRGHLYACYCGGYPFPHRPGGGACERNPMSAYAAALWRKQTDRALEDAWFESVLFGAHRPTTEECPF